MITTLQHISNTKCKNKHQDITNVQYKRNERSPKSSKLTSKSRENTRIINKRHHVHDSLNACRYNIKKIYTS